MSLALGRSPKQQSGARRSENIEPHMEPERAIHSGRLTGQCTSRHPTSLLTDGHGTAAVDRTNPPHSRRETEVPPGGSNGFALACGCRRGEGFFHRQQRREAVQLFIEAEDA